MKIYFLKNSFILCIIFCFNSIAFSASQDTVTLDCYKQSETNQQLVINFKENKILRLIGVTELEYKIERHNQYVIYATGNVSIPENWSYLETKNIGFSELSVSIELNRVNGKVYYTLLGSFGSGDLPKGLRPILEKVDWECKIIEKVF